MCQIFQWAVHLALETSTKRSIKSPSPVALYYIHALIVESVLRLQYSCIADLCAQRTLNPDIGGVGVDESPPFEYQR